MQFIHDNGTVRAVPFTSILGIGYMMAGWTVRKQALHDMMVGCCVVRQDGLDPLADSRVGSARNEPH